MSGYSGRPLPSHLRHQSLANNQTSSSTGGQSPLLQARINEKKAELASLKELQQLSAGLADQMQTLEDKLATLTDGTEAVAAVLSNWHNVLRAINMASGKCIQTWHYTKLAKTGEAAGGETEKPEVPLPQTLVRIPTHQAGPLPQATSGSAAD
ncbi:hypothetical protein K402DRAFT_329585 [Aulographum hederae CBS 113979]|uniref:DASH complex subunit DAD2 n=1 Tax=Aulographum hederae CBS 113979 TaxID=1176131 RepID=A0A6G1H4Y6_9PEZI|nr:hypothetical protein K402DRAFT_329585 [Aulographum hederae CBS 113979]